MEFVDLATVASNNEIGGENEISDIVFEIFY